jgi:hypothetical protein
MAVVRVETSASIRGSWIINDRLNCSGWSSGGFAARAFWSLSAASVKDRLAKELPSGMAAFAARRSAKASSTVKVIGGKRAGAARWYPWSK